MLPEQFLSRMQAQLGDSYGDFMASFERPRAVALRFNPLKGDAPPLPFTGERVPWEPMGYYYDPSARPGLHPFHDAGVYYLQEASAMAPVTLLDPQPGEIILDLCAAPGGKSTQIAGRMLGRGLLISNEINPSRAKVLSQNIERLGISNAVVTNESPAALSSRFPEFFDRVLVDAPCSGEGMFRKEEAAVADWSPEIVAMCARRQAEILDCAAHLLRPGGRLVYSTCTFSPEEDENTVTDFLGYHADFSLEEADAPWFQECTPGMYRLWPHKLLGEGHFAAVLRKAGHKDAPDFSVKSESLPTAWKNFASDLGICLPERARIILFGQSLCCLPVEMPDMHRLKVLRPGLELGSVKKDRFEPAHALAMWLSSCTREISLPVDSPELGAYLRGETLSYSEKGWRLVKAGAYSIGWGKGDGTMLKNHYPKGLRRVK